MIIDAHHHLWDPAVRDYPWMSGAALAPIRRAYTVDDLRAACAGVTRTVLVQTVSSTDETAEFLATAEKSDGLIAGVVGWLDLTAPDLADQLNVHSVVGLRHQVEDEPDPEWLLRKDVQAGLHTLAEHDVAYDLLVRAPQRAAALTAVRKRPEVSFVLDHAGKPAIAAGEWDTWAPWLTEFAREPNVVCKLSGLITEADWNGWQATQIRRYADHVLATFGPDRVLFGSDWPVCELAAGYAEVLALTEQLLAECIPAERTAIMGDNAVRVYRL